MGEWADYWYGETSCAQCGDEIQVSDPRLLIEHGRPFCGPECSQTYLVAALFDAMQKGS